MDHDISHEPGRHRQIDEWPIMDEGAFHGIAGEFARAVDEHTEADPAAVLLSTLVMFGAMVGPRPHALAGNDRHGGNEFVILAGPTAKARKGTSLAVVRACFEHVDPDFLRDRVQSGFGSGEALVDALQDVAGADPRLLVVEPEFARVLTAGQRDGSTLSPVIRNAWDGSKLEARSRARTSVAHAHHVAVLAHVTAEELSSRLRDVEALSGFGNRFMFAAVRSGKVLPTGGNVPAPILESYGARFRDALAVARDFGAMARTPAAESVWAELVYRLAEDESSGLVGALIARDRPHVLRLSALFALLDGRSSIDVAHVGAASAVWDHCRATVAHIFASRQRTNTNDRLRAALIDAGPEGMTASDMHAVFHRNISAAAVEAMRDDLLRSGAALTWTEATGGRPRVITIAAQHARQGSAAEFDGQPTETPAHGPHSPALRLVRDVSEPEPKVDKSPSTVGGTCSVQSCTGRGALVRNGGLVCLNHMAAS